MSPAIGLGKAETLWGKKSYESHVHAKLLFRNSEGSKLPGASQSLPEGESVHADSCCTTAPKPPTEATPLCQMLFKLREGSLQVSIYRHLQIAGHPKYLKGTGR